MKIFRFALSGMIVLLYLFGSCSIEGINFGEQGEAGKPVRDDGSEADKKPSVTDEEADDTPDSGEDDSDDTPDTSSPDNGEDDSDDTPDTSLPDNGEDDSDVTPDISSPDSGESDSGGEPDTFLPEIKVKNPELQINEMRTEYENSSYRVEFIEFKMRTAGDLGGVRVYIAGNYKNPLVFEFLPVEVEKDEYILLHLRTLEDSCVNEYGGMDESDGTDSSPTARDFWIPGSEERLRKTDAVYVLDNNGNVLDAVMLAEKTSAESWPLLSRQDCFTPAAEFLFNNGAWKSANGTIPGPADAVSTSGIGSSKIRSISRDETVEDTDTAADWYITASNGLTPGRENNPQGL